MKRNTDKLLENIKSQIEEVVETVDSTTAMELYSGLSEWANEECELLTIDCEPELQDYEQD